MEADNKSKLFWIGTFVSLGITVFVVSLMYLTDSTINTEYQFNVLFKNGMGVESGSEVKMLGQKIGQVSKVEILDDRNGVIVGLSIIDKLGIKIPNNSIFKTKTTIFGQTHVQIEPGNNSDYISKNDLVQGAIETDSYDLDPVVKDLSAFSRQLSSILTEKEVKALQNIISNSDSLINDAKDSFEVSGQINDILNNIKIFSSELTTISSNLDTSFQPRLNQIDSILIEIEDFTSGLEIVTNGFTSFNSSASNLDSSMIILNALVNEMNEGKGTLGKLLKDDSLYDNLNEVVDNTNSLINQVTADPKSFFNININFGGSK